MTPPLHTHTHTHTCALKLLTFTRHLPPPLPLPQKRPQNDMGPSIFRSLHVRWYFFLGGGTPSTFCPGQPDHSRVSDAENTNTFASVILCHLGSYPSFVGYGRQGGLGQHMVAGRDRKTPWSPPPATEMELAGVKRPSETSGWCPHGA